MIYDNTTIFNNFYVILAINFVISLSLSLLKVFTSIMLIESACVFLSLYFIQNKTRLESNSLFLYNTLKAKNLLDIKSWIDLFPKSRQQKYEKLLVKSKLLFIWVCSTSVLLLNCYQSDHVIENMGRDLIINGDSETLNTFICYGETKFSNELWKLLKRLINWSYSSIVYRSNR